MMKSGSGKEPMITSIDEITTINDLQEPIDDGVKQIVSPKITLKDIANNIRNIKFINQSYAPKLSYSSISPDHLIADLHRDIGGVDFTIVYFENFNLSEQTKHHVLILITHMCYTRFQVCLNLSKALSQREFDHIIYRLCQESKEATHYIPLEYP